MTIYTEKDISSNNLLFPGDFVRVEDEPKKTREVKLDGGLQPWSRGKKRKSNEKLLRITRVGKLRKTNSDRWSVSKDVKRYIPKRDDSVVGVVTDTRSWEATVDIGGPKRAKMSLLAFEGATKRSKPSIEVGSVLYCRVLKDSKDLPPELTCKHPYFKKDWVTGQNIYSELKGGYVIPIEKHFAKRLLESDCFVLKEIALHFKYEVAIGLNGRVWVNSGRIKDTVLICNMIQNAVYLTNEQTQQMVNELIERSLDS